MGDEEVLDLLHLLHLGPVFLSKQTLGFLLILYTSNKETLAFLALSRLAGRWRCRSLLWRRSAIRLDLTRNGLFSSGVGRCVVGWRLWCSGLDGLFRCSSGGGGGAGACRLASILLLLLRNRWGCNSGAGLLRSTRWWAGLTSWSRRRLSRRARVHCSWGTSASVGGCGLSLTRRNLSTSVSEVETLGPHLGTDPAIVNVQYKPSVSSICKVEVPHVLEGALIDLTALRPRSRTTEGVSAIGDSRHLVYDFQR
jgi:hypothetical protein